MFSMFCSMEYIGPLLLLGHFYSLPMSIFLKTRQILCTKLKTPPSSKYDRTVQLCEDTAQEMLQPEMTMTGNNISLGFDDTSLTDHPS